MKNMPIIGFKTVSTKFYMQNRTNAIYPAFVDDMPYQSWTLNGPKDFFQLEANGGEAPFVWEIIKGKLPDGINLSSDGKLFGKAKKEGEFEFTLKVTDVTGKSYIDTLSMTAYPYRGSWFNDTKFGLMVQWGTFSHPTLLHKEDIPKLAERSTQFDAWEWAKQMHELGFKHFNFTVMGGDGVRLWPSTTVSTDGLIATRDYAGELIRACKHYGIKFIAYLPGHIMWSPYMRDWDPGDMTCSTLHLGLVNELIDLGADAVWFDSGATRAVPLDFDWDKMEALIRTKNPFFVIQINAAPGCRGLLLEYPRCDTVTYEGSITTDEKRLDIAYPNFTCKRMAIDVDNMLHDTWANFPEYVGKTAKGMIENIKQNWERNASYTMSIAVETQGKLIRDEDLEKITEICDWVKQNRDKYTLTPHETGLYKFDRDYEWQGECIKVKGADLMLKGLKFPENSPIKRGNYKIIKHNTVYPIAYGKFDLDLSNEVKFEETEINNHLMYYIMIQTDVEYKGNGKTTSPDYISCGAVKTDLSGTAYQKSEDDSLILGIQPIYDVVKNTQQEKNLFFKADDVALMSNDDSRRLSASCSVAVAENLFDRESELCAIAGEEQWAWTYYIELDSVYPIKQMDIEFGENYPTSWLVLLSQDGQEYITAHEQTNGKIETAHVRFENVKAKYIKIRSLKPDGPGQEGVQMSIKSINII